MKTALGRSSAAAQVYGVTTACTSSWTSAASAAAASKPYRQFPWSIWGENARKQQEELEAEALKEKRKQQEAEAKNKLDKDKPAVAMPEDWDEVESGLSAHPGKVHLCAIPEAKPVDPLDIVPHP